MDTKDYHLWKQIQAQFRIELEKKGDDKEAEKIDEEEELDDDVFEAVSKRAWTDILLQIFKVGFFEGVSLVENDFHWKNDYGNA